MRNIIIVTLTLGGGAEGSVKGCRVHMPAAATTWVVNHRGSGVFTAGLSIGGGKK